MRLIYLLLTSLFLYFPLSGQQFINVNHEAGIWHKANRYFTGVVVFDFNNDGWDDILLTSGLYTDSTKLYKNNNGVFTDVTVSSGINILNIQDHLTVGGASADLDNDGDRDLIVTNYLCGGSFCNPTIFRNNGNSTFTDITVTSGIHMNIFSKAVAFGDVNGDGYLDIYFSNYDKGTHYTYDSVFNITGYEVDCYPNFFYLNNKNFTFTDKTSDYHLNNSGCTHTSIFTDFDNDNDVDLLVSNDFGNWFNWDNALYRNKFPVADFEDISMPSNMNRELFSMGIACGDYDNDGDFDYYFTNIGKNIFMRNNGNNTFTDVAGMYHVENEWAIQDSSYQTSWGCNFLDADNDGDEDLFVSCGWFNIDFPYTSYPSPNKLYRSENSGAFFTDVSASAGIDNPLSKSGSALIDYNNDGKMDILNIAAFISRPGVTSDSTQTLLYKNVTNNGNHYLKIKIEGVKNNRDGFGSKIAVYTNGKRQLKEVDGGGSSHSSQGTSYNLFGLGTSTMADSVKVYWLGGRVQTLKNVAADQTINIVEDTTLAIVSKVFEISPPAIAVYPNPVRGSKIKIDVPAAIIFQSYAITDINGRMVQQSNLSPSAKNIQIELPLLNEGYYFLTLTDAQREVYNTRFIILK